DVTLPGDLTIPDGFVLTVPEGNTLTNGHTLTNDGQILGGGTLTGGGVFTGRGVYTLKVARALAPLTAAGVTQTSVTLNAVPTPLGGGTVQYAKNTTGAVPADGWQAGWTFDGLTAGTTYYFFARVAGDGIYQEAVSSALLVQTANGSSGGDSDDGPSFTDEALRAIRNAGDGGTVKLTLPSGGKLPGKVLEAAAGKDITLEIDAGNGAAWILRGTDIPRGRLSDLDLKVDTRARTIPVDVLNALTGEKTAMQLELRRDGPFAFPLTLRLEVGRESAGLFANLYRYDEAAETLAYQSTAKIGADGRADIPFSHASSYAVVIDRTSHAPAALPFTDVAEGDWCYDSVRFVFQKGLMMGTAETAFTPGGPVTRGMAATVLYRLAGSPQDGGEGSAFPDVPASAYCADAVRWAASAGLVGGYADGTFRPGDPVTRQALAAMLYRYARHQGWDVSAGETTDILRYTDASDAAEWAVPALRWACGAGILTGTADHRLAPRAGATRAQLAAVLTRLAGN
ncbi:S-layer homology domain-containing protein, partial [uncultured Oscillibacter sp.]|uniref:S-layer homology domain-containing protein n=1 Tax=uncultured Oscillibacter sp. TaxID=876091 RepID=UPI0025F0EBA3